MKYALKIGSNTYDVELGEMINGKIRVEVNGKPFEVLVEKLTSNTQNAPPTPAQRPREFESSIAVSPSAPASGHGTVIAPIPGLMMDIRVKVGDKVESGQCVATMEAMKMENNLITPVSGTVLEILVSKGAEVNTGQVIMRIG
jgi:biotin carboxyl carrier protein